MQIGNNIKYWRELRNMTQSELAHSLNISDKTVSSWEINRTEPKMGMIQNICSVLNCRTSDIIGDNETTEKEQYYIDNETAKIAQEIFENKELKMLFDVTKNSTPQRLMAYYKMIKELEKQENHEEE